MALALSDIVANALTDVQVAAGATSFNVNLPTSGVSAGMLMVICISLTDAADIADGLTTPSDWTRQGGALLPNTTSTPRVYVFWREVPGGGLGSTVTISETITTAFNAIAVAFAVQNADTSALDVFSSLNTGTGTTLTCPAVTAGATGGLTIRVAVADDDDQASQPAMSGHSAINWEENSTPGNGQSIYVYAATQPSTSVGTASITIVTEEWGGYTFVIAEAVAGPVITDVETDEEFDDKDTNVTATGTGFGTSQGIGTVELGSAATYGASTLQAQTVTSWSDTAIDFTAVLGSLTPGSLWLYVTNNSSQVSAGFPVTVHRAIAFVLAASANIAASGENTTPQLAAPAGKTTDDFGGGRIQDDENPGDAVDLAGNEYREDEWCIQATSNAVEGVSYEFRVVLSGGAPINTYTVTPAWTIAAPGQPVRVRTQGIPTALGRRDRPGGWN